MKKKNKRATNTRLPFILFLLVLALSLFGTFAFGRQPFNSPALKKERTNVVKVGKQYQVGNTSGNLAQQTNGSHGLLSSSGNITYKVQKQNGLTNLVKYKNEKPETIMSLKDIRLLNIVGNYLYFIGDKAENKENTSTVAKIDIETDELMYIETTKSTSINSLTFDSKNAYYTVKDDHNIYMLKEDDSIRKIHQTKSNQGFPSIVGIHDGFLYFINTSALYKLNLADYKAMPISYDYATKEHNVIIANSGIFTFGSLDNKSIICLDFNGKETNKLQWKNKIKSFNVIDNVLFFYDGENVYYVNVDNIDTVKKIEGVNPKTPSLYLTDRYLITEDDIYGKAIFNKIAWILAS